MANAGPDARGLIVFGVADDKEDAKAVKSFHGVDAFQVDRFFVTGTQHELTKLGRSMDDHYLWLTNHIKNSPLDKDFANALASTLVPFRYKSYLLWQVQPVGRDKPITYDGKFFQRVGPQTVEASDPSQIIDLVRRFPS